MPAASAATSCALKVFSSRVAVCIEKYSIFSWPLRTHRRMIEGRAPSVNSLQKGHSRSPNHLSVTGAIGWPRVFALCGMPPSRLSIPRSV